jgi:hypothetical protein
MRNRFMQKTSHGSEAVTTSFGRNGKKAEGSHDEGRCLKINHGKPRSSPPPTEPRPEAMMIKEAKTLINDSLSKLQSLRDKLHFYMTRPPPKILALQYQASANLLKARKILERLEHGKS